MKASALVLSVSRAIHVRGEEQAPYRIERRSIAQEDLRAIVRYIGKDNPASARSFGQELRDKTRPAAQHDEFGRGGRSGLPESVREPVAHRNYIVFYRVL